MAGPVFRLSLVFGSVVIVGLCYLALFLDGSSVGQLIDAVFGGGDDFKDVVLRDFRVPRILLAILVGAALSVAGAIMQVVTRNPLADPGLLGITHGAYLAIVLGFLVGYVTPFWNLLIVPLLGASIAAGLVYFIGNIVTPGQLILVGVALTALISGLARSVALINQDIFDVIRHWAVGSLDYKKIDTVYISFPLILAGILIALMMMSSLNVLSIDKDISKSLGVGKTALWSYIAVIALSAGSTAAVGPISFLALAAAHISRVISGPNLLRIIPLCLITGPIVLLTADTLGRVLTPTGLDAGVVVPFLGAPILIFLSRKVKVF
ncbi:FecCD family ABC transporter permease [Tropheryma whipplei]|uniref:Iron ABC transporter permease protein n=1 Tax=Tropheryma whipplei (strain Twist) TaxID=203267 RepID=Q83N41_TROWT|nr:iron ABC transporter permease [Tropheryma whipplei]AAO44157.1 iron ABC transporter permease protein [Tropheryma whipplei str. Twist]MCO8182681.1 iron ABC transporter permease [Tropheryma whipplei]CAD66757.1 putative iron-siderophore uptake system integral membrane component [Tropheryma whipplei TW08/27]